MDELGGRIRDEGLRSFAAGADSSKKAVTIELALPFPKVEFERGDLGSGKAMRPKRVVQMPEGEAKAARKVERAARAAINGIVKDKVKWLELGKAGFTRVSAEELRQLAEVKGVRFIHPRED